METINGALHWVSSKNTIPCNPDSIGYDSEAILSFVFEEEKSREVPAPTDYCLGLVDEFGFGLVVDGGGEKKGIVGIVVGMFGSEGIVVGIVVGSGGSVAVGTLGIVGNIGLGRDGTWLLGKGGNVGLGRVGAVGRVGNWVVGNGGSVAVGSVGMAGKGGSVALGRGGIVGSVGATCGEACKRLRAANVT
ncbi:hypothetical protein LguiB_018690 [Lonicera macranthoides]